MRTANPASADKGYLRDYYMESRYELCDDVRHKEALDTEIQTRLIISPEYRAASAVLVYMARPYEIATSMIIHAALANHKTVGLPVCLDGGAMQFRAIRSLRDLRPGRFGILEPAEDCEILVPDADTLCVCPALCCDMQGHRLGFGGGYYDRFLADFHGMTAALCYSDSVIPSMEHDDYDIGVQVIHTDNFTRYITELRQGA